MKIIFRILKQMVQFHYLVSCLRKINSHSNFVLILILELFNDIKYFNQPVSATCDSPGNPFLLFFFFQSSNNPFLGHFDSAFFISILLMASANRLMVFFRLLNPSLSSFTPSRVSFDQKFAPRFAPKEPPLTGIDSFRM